MLIQCTLILLIRNPILAQLCWNSEFFGGLISYYIIVSTSCTTVLEFKGYRWITFLLHYCYHYDIASKQTQEQRKTYLQMGLVRARIPGDRVSHSLHQRPSRPAASLPSPASRN